MEIPKQKGIVLSICAALIFGGWATASSANGVHEVTVTNTIRISRTAKWTPRFWFGNVDDPTPPPSYKPNDKHRATKWYWRNPMHNLSFYVIGVADKTFHRRGRYPEQVFIPRGGWNWAVTKYKWWRLPFASYSGKSVHFYAGWRDRGNFGLKLTIQRPRPSARQQAGGGVQNLTLQRGF